MYYTLRRIYRKTHKKEYLDKAVTLGWITAEQENKIIAEVVNA